MTEAQFWDRVAKSDGCWLWSGARTGPGYGWCARGDGLPETAHRRAYVYANGPIPRGKLVCHSCDNRMCCNPAHLFLGTHKQNSQDMVAKGRVQRWRGSLTHCKYGHEFTEANTRTYKGKRNCRQCMREYMRVWSKLPARNKATA